jgi:hypothetical protein
MSTLSYAVADSTTMLRRQLRHMLRYASVTVFLIGMPIVFLLLFVYVFGGTLGAGLGGPAGGRAEYLEYVVPGILLMAVAAGEDLVVVAGRDPLRPAGEQQGVDLGLLWDGELHRHPHGVPAIAYLGFVAPDAVDDPVLPRRGVAPLGRARLAQRLGEGRVGPPPARGLIGHLPQQVGQVVEGVDHLVDVGLLEGLDARVQRQDLVVEDRADPDPVDVVGGVEGVTLDVVRRRAEVQGPAVEQHHRDVDASRARGDDTVAEPVEEHRIEPVQIKPRLAVRRPTRTGSRPRLRDHAKVEVAPGGLGPELLPAPEPDEVVAVLGQEVEVGPVVEPLGGLGADRPGTHPVVEVIPDMGSGQIDRLLVCGIAGRSREVARVRGGDDEGSTGGAGPAHGVGRGVHDALFAHAGTVGGLCLAVAISRSLPSCHAPSARVPGGNGSAAA